MIKYKTTWDRIEAVDVVRETKHQVVIVAHGRERRENKESDWQNYHDTWEEAKAFLVAGAERKCNGLRRELEQAIGKLGLLRGMRKPDNAIVAEGVK